MLRAANYKSPVNRFDFQGRVVRQDHPAVVERGEVTADGETVPGQADQFPDGAAPVFQRVNDGVAVQAVVFLRGVHVVVAVGCVL